MKDDSVPPQADLRSPDEVMRLARLGAMFPTRLSFLRTLLRRLSDDKVQVTRPVWRMDADGFGHAVYALKFGGYDYALVAVSTDLPPDMRTDRVIATAWDSAFVLYDGVPDETEIARIVAAAPKQEAARFTEKDLILSRANKSVRLFSHVTERLRSGRQPDAEMIRDVGYLMRTTAVYGNGKFGIADRHVIEDRPGLEGPFAAEMLTVWLIRHFTHELAEHVGRASLDVGLKRHLGIGNSTGLGMAPFLVNHPVLLNNWMMARETALARARAIEHLDASQQARIIALAARAAMHLEEWNVPDPQHQKRITDLRVEWSSLQRTLDLARPFALDHAMRHAQEYSVECQELLAALAIEPFGDLVDGLAECMGDPFGAFCPPFSDTSAVKSKIEADFAWALSPDYEADDQCSQFWYVSEAKAEPRLGARYSEPGSDLESPLDIGRRIAALYGALGNQTQPLSAFLARYPEHALAVERVEIGQRYPYAEIHDNLIAASCLPIDMLRCKLSFFGASKFDPKSDRWTRITLCQGAPLVGDLDGNVDDWWLPVFAP
jgi:hypothetical protein